MSNRILLVRVPSDGKVNGRALRDYILESLPKGVLVLTEDTTYEVMELPPQGGAEFETTEKQEALAENSDPPFLIPDDAAKKRAILQRLNDYRKGNGLGCLEKVSEKTAHFKTDRLSAETLRMIITGDVPRMGMDEWEKIARALDALESKNNAPNHT